MCVVKERRRRRKQQLDRRKQQCLMEERAGGSNSVLMGASDRESQRRSGDGCRRATALDTWRGGVEPQVLEDFFVLELIWYLGIKAKGRGGRKVSMKIKK